MRIKFNPKETIYSQLQHGDIVRLKESADERACNIRGESIRISKGNKGYAGQQVVVIKKYGQEEIWFYPSLIYEYEYLYVKTCWLYKANQVDKRYGITRS